MKTWSLGRLAIYSTALSVVAGGLALFTLLTPDAGANDSFLQRTGDLDDLIAPSGTTDDGVTYGPLPIASEGYESADLYAETMARAPQYISVLGGGGTFIAGYADRDILLAQRSDSEPVPVYDETLKNVVGLWYFSAGFVPNGEQPTTRIPSSVSEGIETVGTGEGTVQNGGQP